MKSVSFQNNTSQLLYRIRSLKHSYGKRPILDIASLDIFRGEVLGVVGMNGSGKSTLLKVLGMLEPVSAGDFSFEGRSVLGLEGEIRKKVCLLLQDSFLLKRTIFENVAYGLRLRGDVERLEERVFDVLARVGLAPQQFVKRFWYELSGGEVQRVALAARLALRPSVLLLDEPTANVDAGSAFLLREAALSVWRDWGTTVIVATHDLAWLNEVVTNTISLHEGKIAGRGIQNIIAGKWQREKDGFVLALSSGEYLNAVNPSADTPVCALLNPEDIRIETDVVSQNGNDVAVTAQISQIVLERGRDTLLVTAEICDFSLKIRIKIRDAQEKQLIPGKKVILSFSKSAIYWH